MRSGGKAPFARRVELAFAVCGSPVAWLAQINMTYPLLATPCFPGAARNLVFPVHAHWAFTLAVASYLAMLVLALASAFAARRLYRQFTQQGGSSGDHFEGAGVGRQRFLAFSGMLLGVGFTGLILLNALALVVVPPCAI